MPRRIAASHQRDGALELVELADSVGDPVATGFGLFRVAELPQDMGPTVGQPIAGSIAGQVLVDPVAVGDYRAVIVTEQATPLGFRLRTRDAKPGRFFGAQTPRRP